MKTYVNRVALLIEVVVDEDHPGGRMYKHVSELDPEASRQMCASVVDSILNNENVKATWATMNVVAVSDVSGM